MKRITTPADIKSLGTILSVWAHPDDESFSCAGIMATAVKNGQKVICVTATKGEAGVQDPKRWPPEKLADVRTQEMLAALKELGITEHFWLGYKDGHCHEVPVEEGTARVKKFIDRYRPDTILCFGPEGMTGHPDHQAVSHWATQAAKSMKINVYYAVEEQHRYDKYMKEADKKFNIYFNIDKPPLKLAASCDIAFTLPKETVHCKCKALKAMPSQTEKMFKNMPTDIMDEMMAQECFVLAEPDN